MILPFVADASVAISWVLPAQLSPASDDLLDQLLAGRGIAVPALWPYEVANTLVTALRRKKISTENYVAARTLLGGLRASIDDDGIRLGGREVADLATSN